MPQIASPAGKYPFLGPRYQGEKPGYVYNPWKDQYFIDPKAYQQYGYDTGQAEKPKAPPGLAEQLIPIAGVGGALVAGQQLGKELPGLIGAGLDKLGGAFGGATPATEATSSLLGGAEPVASTVLADGSPATILADGSIAGESGFSLGGIGGAGNYVLPAAGLLGAYDLIKNKRKGARGIAQGAASGAAIGSFFPGAGTLVGAGVGGLLGAGMGLFDQKSTKDYENERWGGLIDRSSPGVAEQIQHFKDVSHPEGDTGEQWKQQGGWEALKKRATPEDLWGTYGVFDTFGNDWLEKYNEDQRRKITQKLIDNNLFGSGKGDIIVTDKTKARQLAEEVLSGKEAKPVDTPKPLPSPIPGRTPGIVYKNLPQNLRGRNGD